MTTQHPSIVADKPAAQTWFNTVAIVLLGCTVAGGGIYLNHRAQERDTQTRQTDHAICTILDALGPASAIPPQFRGPYDRAFTEAGCAQFKH